jgi:hypothetical protein
VDGWAVHAHVAWGGIECVPHHKPTTQRHATGPPPQLLPMPNDGIGCGMVHAYAGHEEVLLTFFKVMFVPMITYNDLVMSQNHLYNTQQTAVNMTTMVVELLAPPESRIWSTHLI